MTVAEGVLNQNEGAQVPATTEGAAAPANVALRSNLPIFAGTLQPSDMEGLYRLAGLLATSKLTPKGMETKEQVFVCLAMGLEIGLSPMASLQNIAVVNGRPTVWGDALLALVENSGQLMEVEETLAGTDVKTWAATCRAVRKFTDGRIRATSETFSMDDARMAGLAGKAGPWQQYPKRMLKYRARSFALRDLFPDILKGIRTTEEMQDVDEPVRTSPGSAFEAEDVPRTPQAQPEPALPLLKTSEKTQESTQPPPAPETRAGAEAPKGEPAEKQEGTKERRRRTKGPYPVPEDLLDTFSPEAEVMTAGIHPNTLWDVARLVIKVGEPAVPVADKYLSVLTSPAYVCLREDEGQALLAELVALQIGPKKETAPAAETPVQEEAPPHPAETEAAGAAGPRFALGESVLTKWGEAAIVEVSGSPHPEHGFQYKVQREKDGKEYAGADFFQYEGQLKPAPAGAAGAAANPGQGNGGKAGHVWCTRDKQWKVSAVCDQKCQDRDDCPQFAEFQAKTAAPVNKPLFG
jgi:hypothetical protein